MKVSNKHVIHKLFQSRFIRWWLTFSGVYAMFGVCPFCGRTGCPIGAGSMGLVGGFFALCMQGVEKGKEIVKSLRKKQKAGEIEENCLGRKI